MSSPIRILLIDDNPVDRARIIQELGQGFAELQVQQVSSEGGFGVARWRPVPSIWSCATTCCPGRTAWRSRARSRRDGRRCRCSWSPEAATKRSRSRRLRRVLDDYILKSHRHLARLSTAVRSALDRVEQQRRLDDVAVRYQDRLRSGARGLVPSHAGGGVPGRQSCAGGHVAVSEPGKSQGRPCRGVVPASGRLSRSGSDGPSRTGSCGSTRSRSGVGTAPSRGSGTTRGS